MITLKTNLPHGGRRLGRGPAAIVALVSCIVLVSGIGRETPCSAQTTPKAKSQRKEQGKGEINKQFENPDVPSFVKRFESESREVFTQRENVIRALSLRPGMAVADVGAGTGFYTRLFADKVGKEGAVYAVDISASFLKHIAEESKKQGQSQVKTVLGAQDTTNLPKASVDLVFICDTYHHFEKPGVVLASIHQALKPGGMLVVIDFDRRPGKSSEFVLGHIRASKEVFFQEIEQAGFNQTDTPDAPKFEENFFAKFRKVETTPKAP